MLSKRFKKSAVREMASITVQIDEKKALYKKLEEEINDLSSRREMLGELVGFDPASDVGDDEEDENSHENPFEPEETPSSVAVECGPITPDGLDIGTPDSPGKFVKKQNEVTFEDALNEMPEFLRRKSNNKEESEEIAGVAGEDRQPCF